VQYRVFLVSRTPTPPETVEVHRALVDRIRIGGEA
jgi:hypothetical protein